MPTATIHFPDSNRNFLHRDDACTHAPCRTRIFLAQFLCVASRHRVHAWLKVFAVRMSYLSISPSPFSCFILLLCCSRTVTLTPRSRLPVPDPKARVWRTSARAARSLATWPNQRTPQVMSPNSSTRIVLQTETRRLSTIRITMASLASRKPSARALDCSVFPQCLKPLFRKFLKVVLLFREKAKKACLGKPLQDRVRDERERFCDQCCRVDVNEKSTEQY